MYIGKPFRFMLVGAMTGAATGVAFAILEHHVGLWAIILTAALLPIFYGISGLAIDIFDSWLRRVTREPIWVMHHEQDGGFA